jgi:hypothetical protein
MNVGSYNRTLYSNARKNVLQTPFFKRCNLFTHSLFRAIELSCNSGPQQRSIRLHREESVEMSQRKRGKVEVWCWHEGPQPCNPLFLYTTASYWGGSLEQDTARYLHLSSATLIHYTHSEVKRSSWVITSLFSTVKLCALSQHWSLSRSGRLTQKESARETLRPPDLVLT